MYMPSESSDSLFSIPRNDRKFCMIFVYFPYLIDSVIMKFASGGVSGIVSRTICAPFSRLSVLQETRVSVKSSPDLVVAESNRLRQTVQSIFKRDGLFCDFV